LGCLLDSLLQEMKSLRLLSSSARLKGAQSGTVGSARSKHNRSSCQDRVPPQGGSLGLTAVAAATSAAIAWKLYSEKESLKLEAKTVTPVQDPLSVSPEQKNFDNRVRQYQTPDNVFSYFASLQLVNKFGRKTTMMSPMDFYSSITPDCVIHPGCGSGIYEQIVEQHLEKLMLDKSPIENSVLNEIGVNGLLSYSDYCFLLTLLATPPRFIDTAFNMFDVTGDEMIAPKEFAYVCTKMAHKAGGFGTYTDIDQAEILGSNSGLLNYLFGKDRKKSLTREGFTKFQADLLDEIVQLEFRQYDPDCSGRISEKDFCCFLLKRTKVPPKQRAMMLKRVEKIWPSKGRGISLPSFKNFFCVLAGGLELERGLFFLDVEGIGVDLEEFRKVCSWVSRQELSDHIAEVVFVMLDDQGSGRIFKEAVGPVLFDWRQPRGYDKGSIHVSMGQLTI